MDINPVLLERINNGDNGAFDEMVSNNMGLVRSIAGRYIGRGCDREDLIQIGAIGLIKAIRRFDTEHGVKFSTYAVPMISGEIKRFLRDDGMIKISRSIKETALKGKTAENILRQRMGSEPSIGDVADECGISVDEMVYAYEACAVCESLNEYAANGAEEKEDRLSVESYEDDCINKIWISEALTALSPKERQVIVLRYMKCFTQSKIADMIGVSQVQVSRIEKKALDKIKILMETT